MASSPRGYRYQSPAFSQHPHTPHHFKPQALSQDFQLEMPTDRSVQPPSTPPRTPRRDYHGSNLNGSIAPEHGSKQRSHGKNRPKNVMISPAVHKKGQNISPPTSALSASLSTAKAMNTPSTAAYAGPTFHSSPAPSTLPIPSFYSKSMPDSPGVNKTLRLLKDGQAATPPTKVQPANESQRQESPLDLFFKADREQKARVRSASSAQLRPGREAGGPFAPPMESPCQRQPSPYRRSQGDGHLEYGCKTSAAVLFAMELDGESDSNSPYELPFSTPYAERISAAKSTMKPPHSGPQLVNGKSSLENSEALKAYLFSGPKIMSSSNSFSVAGSCGYPTEDSHNGSKSAGLPPTSFYNHIYGNDNMNTTNAPRPSGRSSGLRQEVTTSKTPNITPQREKLSRPSQNESNYHLPHNSPSASASLRKEKRHSSMGCPNQALQNYGISSNNRKTDLQGMEESLRKMLKLDSMDSSGVTRPAIGIMPVAVVSAPNYVAGRVSPMDGMQNGVIGS